MDFAAWGVASLTETDLNPSSFLDEDFFSAPPSPTALVVPSNVLQSEGDHVEDSNGPSSTASSESTILFRLPMRFLWMAIKDKPLIFLLLSATLVLGLSMCNSATLHSSSVWKSAAAAIVVHIMMVAIASLNNWQGAFLTASPLLARFTHHAQHSNDLSSADSPIILPHSIPRGSRHPPITNRKPLTNGTPDVAPTHLTNTPNRPENHRASNPRVGQHIGHAPSTFEPSQLARMIDSKSLDSLVEFGGADGLLRGLGTDRVHGLSTKPPCSSPTAGLIGASTPPDSMIGVSIHDRQRFYGSNNVPSPRGSRLPHFFWITIKDKPLVSSLLSAALMIGLSMCGGATLRSASVWKGAAAVIVAHILLVIFGSLNDWHRERQLSLVNHARIGHLVTVIRDGAETVIDAKDVVVGDIALLQPGDIIPADGVFLSGHNVRCDESGASGGSDAIIKIRFEECVDAAGLAASGLAASPQARADCFLVSGTTVLEGYGSYLIVAVGILRLQGHVRNTPGSPYHHSPTQISLNSLAAKVTRVGSLIGLSLFVALMIEFFAALGRGTPKRSPIEHGIAFVSVWLITTSLVVVAIPTNLPLAGTLALSSALKHLNRAGLRLKSYSACETSGEVSLVCTSGTGVLTQNRMTVVAGSVGIHAKFVRPLDLIPSTSDPSTSPRSEPPRKHADNFCVQLSQLPTTLPLALQNLLNESIAVNTTAFEDVDPETGSSVFVGSRREAALLSFAGELGWESYKAARHSKAITQMIPFSSARRMSAIVIVNPRGGYRVYVKGASEMLAKKCTRAVKTSRDAGGSEEEVETVDLDPVGMDNISRTIISYGNEGLRSISLCYKDLPEWPSRESVDASYDGLASDLTLLAIFGIEDPLRGNIRETVANLNSAGIEVKMCTGENALTARHIALQAGIFTPGGVIMEGTAFRHLCPADRDEILPRLQVLACASPADRHELIQAMKALGEVVGSVSGGAEDGPTLEAADVGFSMGVMGAEAAKEASDIILMDDGFGTMSQAILWGRSFAAAIRRLLQFVLTTTISAVVIVFISSVASAGADPALTPVQLLWIALIMDTLSSLALVTDRPSPRLWATKPQKTPLISTAMYKQIIAQCLYQIVITLVFHFAGIRLLRLEGDPIHQSQVLDTLVFNFYIFAQMFNTLNCRVIDSKSYNVLHRVFWNPLFISIVIIEIVAQVFIISFGGPALNVTQMNVKEWAISVGLGAGTLLLGLGMRFLRDGPFDTMFRRLGVVPNPSVLPVVRPTWSYEPRIANQDNLNTFAFLRGGRLMSLSPRVAIQPEEYTPPTPKNASDALESLADPTKFKPTLSDSALWDGALQLHPETCHDDPTYQAFVTDAQVAPAGPHGDIVWNDPNRSAPTRHGYIIL